MTEAHSKNFIQVKFQKISQCPYCGSSEYSEIGSFIYYSTFHTVRECKECQLCFVDVLIDEVVRTAHFEKVYKLESYFEDQRKDIFEYILKLINTHSPDAKHILEIGGATGVLLEMIRKRFSNVTCILNDISQEACEAAKKRGFETAQGEIASINLREKQDIILAIDVLYYELNIKKSFEVMFQNLATDGILILRLPNKYYLIKLFWFLVGRRKFPPFLKFFKQLLYI